MFTAYEFRTVQCVGIRQHLVQLLFRDSVESVIGGRENCAGHVAAARDPISQLAVPQCPRKYPESAVPLREFDYI